MSQKSKFLGFITLTGVLLFLSIFLFNIGGIKDKVWRLIQPDIIAENSMLKNTNEDLSRQMEELKNQYLSLKKVFEAYEHNFIELKNASGNCSRLQILLPIELPLQIAKERFEIRQMYRQMLIEKNRWDYYQQEKYKNILEGTVEPVVVETQELDLDFADNSEYFQDLEKALKLHKRLIRDVRDFHDEIRFQKEQLSAQKPYSLFDLKFELAPFARESALVDALQQAMSALSAGIYEQEAMAVLDRIGDEFTKPIRKLYEQQQDTAEPSVAKDYNYNFYTLFGKKLMDYSDNLARQSSIPLGPSAFGELDFFNRRLSESLYDLYLVGLDEALGENHLDLDELEKLLQ